MEIESMNLTAKEAYLVMFRFLEKQYEMTNSDDIGSLLGELQLTECGLPIDQANWDDWVKSIYDIKAGVDNSRMSLKK